MPRTATGVDCAQCGLTSGHYEVDGDVRCGECGRYAEPTSDYCAEHGVNVRRLSGYDECPRCKQQRDVRAREREMHQRRADPQMHNMVDAPANAIDHSRSPSDFI